MRNQRATLADIGRFSAVIDVRTPAEFAEDHIPGAINAPVLSNEERVTVGTMYAQVSPFEATKVGAALVAQNIARHLQTLFADRPINWKPLIYCWRGGKRSGAMTAWFSLIGWKACQLEGGYKAFRHHVLEDLKTLPRGFEFRVLAGLTGSGKTRLLRALAGQGAQVLDLEGLARHRGSLLGAVPGEAQPSQKGFDTSVWKTLSNFDAGKPVFVEAESRKIGQLQVPETLIQAMGDSPCVRVEASLDNRVEFLCEDYAALMEEPAQFKELLSCLVGLHGREVIGRWHGLIDTGAKTELFRELLERHYDPAYRRSSHGLYRKLPQAQGFAFHPNSLDLADEAQRFLASL
jgi:tRNA 2-selenouridine synthase